MSHRHDRGLPIMERFEAKLAPEPSAGCWLWTAATQGNGYGRFADGCGNVVFAHRWSYEQFIGPIPDGMQVLHRCDTPPCVNPDHLFLGTQGDNVRDAVAKGRYRNGMAAKTHCKHGHAFDVENTRWNGPRRTCRACSREKSRKHRRLNSVTWSQP